MQHTHLKVARRESGNVDSIFSNKLTRKSSRVKLVATVPQTDTGGWVEYTKAYERTLV